MKNDAMRRRAGGVKLPSLVACAALVTVWFPVGGHAQVNSGSNGSDGALNPTQTNTVINMADHPTGIYHYTSVNIPNGVTVTFIPNANNAPVVWLVQSNVVISGTVDVSGHVQTNGAGGLGGPGGFAGGCASCPGLGPGGGQPTGGQYAGSGSFGCIGPSPGAGPTYGNIYCMPLIGGSGGAGNGGYGGGGGGGAILIASSGEVRVDGAVWSKGADWATSGGYLAPVSGFGSGGAVRIVASTITGSGSVSADSARFGQSYGCGRIRFDTPYYNYGGGVSGIFTAGFQPIIMQTNGQGAQLTISSVGGVPVSASPSGQLATPDALLSAQQNNPIPIAVHCSNIPLNTAITVSVRPANGATVTGVGYNNTGTLASSAATVSLNMPRGGGIIYATAATAH